MTFCICKRFSRKRHRKSHRLYWQIEYGLTYARVDKEGGIVASAEPSNNGEQEINNCYRGQTFPEEELGDSTMDLLRCAVTKME